jgi:hypothetical protein
MTDLCWVCQNNNTQIQRSANLQDDEKLKLLREQEDHLRSVSYERILYNNQVAAAKLVASNAESFSSLKPHPPNAKKIEMHYSFDYAQQVHLPSNPLQPGPIYFKVPRKCGLFGVCCEAIPQQINFCIDEGVCSGKGSNEVISYLDFFFDNYGFGEQTVHLHCDNCAGQNKNRFVLQYLAWRTLTNRHTEINLHFMVAGHTKFAPDWCFGLLKKKFRRHEVNCLKEFAHVINTSTINGINRTQLVGTEDQQVFVPVYNWQDLFRPHAKSFPGIQKTQHFRFSSNHPGAIFFRKSCSDDEECLANFMRSAAVVNDGMPALIPPPGLSKERKEYLFHQIRQFVSPECQDVLCPKP